MKASSLSSKVAIAVLARGHTRLSDYSPLILRNHSIFRTLAQQTSSCGSSYSVDYVIFHEGNISFWHRLAISACAIPHRLIFRNINKYFLAAPPSLSSPSPWCRETSLSSRFTAGYKTMCRFWLDGFLSYLSGYDYIVRVDDDCCLTSFPLSSIINDIESGTAEYVTAKLEPRDDPDVTVGLPEFATWFRGGNPNLLHPSLDSNPYTNFFVLNTKYFSNSTEFARFAAAVHSSCCIHINRWGDMPLWGVFLSMLKRPGVLSVRSDISYYHGSHGLSVNITENAIPPAPRNPMRWRLFLYVDSVFHRIGLRRRIKRLLSSSLIRRSLSGWLQ